MRVDVKQQILSDPRIQNIARVKGINPEQLAQAIDSSGLDVTEFLKFYVNETASSTQTDGNTHRIRGPGMQPIAELANQIKKAGAAQKMTVGTVGNIPVAVTIGYLEKTPADAVVAPQWPGNAGSYGGGVGRALIGAGARNAYEDYDAHCKRKTTNFGDTHVSPSGVALFKNVINAVTVGSKANEEFQVIEDATFNILKAAAEKGIRTVGFPALGTGVIGNLTPEQSSRAITNGIARASREGLDVEVAIVLWAGHPSSAEQGFKAFSDTVTAGVFGSAPETGRKQFDLARWVADNTGRVI